MAIPALYVDAPELTLRRFGLFSVADIQNLNDGHWQAGVEYETLNCVESLDWAEGLCESGTKVTSEGIDLAEFAPIVAYHQFECRAIGSFDRAGSVAVRRFNASEQSAVERGVQEFWNSASVEITSGAGVCPEQALGLAEQFLAEQYGGVGAIHAPAVVATRLVADARVRRHGNRLETELGTLVSSGAYDPTDGPTVTSAGEGWLWVTGRVGIRRGNSTVKPDPHFGMDPLNNTITVLVERPYVVDWDCVVGAVKVSLSC